MLKLIGLLVLMFAVLTNGLFMQPGFFGAPQGPFPGQFQPGPGRFPGQFPPGPGRFPGQFPPGLGPLPGQFPPAPAPANLQINNCPVTQACQALSLPSNSNLAPVLQQTIASLASQITQTALFSPNQQVTFPCTNYDPSAKPNGCRANIPLMTNFNVNAFLGKWYFLAMYNFGSIVSGIGCGTDVFTLNGNSLTLTTTFYNTNGSSIPANIPLDLNTFNSAEMKFNFNGSNDVRIVATDYTSYVIWYNCGTSSTGEPFERLEVAVRSATSVSASTLSAIISQLNRIGFSPCEVGFVGRSTCPSV